ncbi:family 16 glycosylhydrolase [Erysipelothrix urinaevulpis]|uniref:family 16 glycosylhydrolase n=1 Tax=Erysipelothrix urinaevulpis TaxID=2683717 RepID=UPI00135B0587|nr:family 16 glycosylhydrolase [Erysipelothrix urinaevulpis]
MKKSMSNLFKSFLVLLVMVSSVNPISAETKQETPIIVDGDFEKGGAAWNQRNKGEIADGVSFGNGTKSGVIPNTAVSNGMANGFIGQVVNLEQYTDYTVSAYVKVDVEGADAIFTGRWWANNSQQSVIEHKGSSVDKAVTNTEWTKVEYTFNTEKNKQALIQLVKWSDKEETKKSNAYIDNVVITKGETKLPEEEKPKPEESYKEVWRDEFDQDQLNSDDWGYELGMIRGTEHQHYVNDEENVFLRDGKLVLRATDRAKEDQYDHPRDPSRKVKYNSGSIRTHGKREFLYGKLEIKAKLPKGKAVFPAFWTLGADFTLDGKINGEQGHGWPSTGEIDIMELIGSETYGAAGNRTVYQTVHYGPTEENVGKFSGSGTSHTIGEVFNDDFHTFAFDWHEDRMDWYVDDVLVRTVPYAQDPMAKDIFSKPQYIQLNLAMGGAWPGHVGDGLAGTEFEVDYVSYSQTETQAKANQSYYETAPYINGVKPLTMTRGQAFNPLKDLSTKEGYFLDFSIEDSPMFDHKGGNKNVNLKVAGVHELDKLSKLPAGTYNIHYSALPEGVKLNDDLAAKVARTSTTLEIVKNSLADDLEFTVQKGTKLKDIELPQDWYWTSPDTVVNKDQKFEAYYQTLDTNEKSMVQVRIEKVDYTLLDEKIAEAEALLNNNKYTPESKEYLVKTIELLKEIRKTEMTEEQVRISVEYLDFIISNLEEKNDNGNADVDTPTDNKTDGDTTTEDNSDKTPDSSILPQTGISAFSKMNALSLSLIVIGLGIKIRNKE